MAEHWKLALVYVVLGFATWAICARAFRGERVPDTALEVLVAMLIFWPFIVAFVVLSNLPDHVQRFAQWIADFGVTEGRDPGGEA